MSAQATKNAKAKMRIGRPIKPTPKGKKRLPLGLIVAAEVKRRIDEEAERSGLTQSQVAERLIERAFQYDNTLAAMRTNLADMERGSAEAALHRMGFTQHRDHVDATGKAWKSWLEPGHPKAPKRSGWVEDEK